MKTTYKTNNAEISKYSYESIAAKLSGYVEKSQNIRLINSFASQDPNRSKANITFLKQFGVVPQDLTSRYGEIDLNEIADLDGYDGLTVILESIFVSDTMHSSVVTNRSQLEKMYRNINLIKDNKNTVELCDMLTEGHVNTINEQIKILAKLIETKRQNFRGGYIYVSGFSCVSSDEVNAESNELGYLPWYLEIGNMNGMPKIFAQPELDFLLRKLPEQPPLIANLDDFLDDMASVQSDT